jgi:serine/threonine protein kinase
MKPGGQVIGETLNHFHIVSKIGEGGMGVVYRAHDQLLDRDVAVKVVRKDPGANLPPTHNLLDEARASSSLAHPNICTIYEVGETEGNVYIVMELVEGQSLRELSRGVGIPPEAVLRYGIQIAAALVRAHDRGIVHRDLKSANIVVTREGLAKVLDFGLARQMDLRSSEESTLAAATSPQSSGISGTLHYLAPEILRGEPADGRGDIWALGVVLYEAACGKMPFNGHTTFEISSAIFREMPAPLGPPVPPGLWATIQRCLAKEPAQRYQRAGEVQAALEAVQSAAILDHTLGSERGEPRTTVLHSVRHVRLNRGDSLLLVGTIKGAFILRSNAQRSRWEVGGPYFHGHAVYALAYDDRAGRQRIWASTQSYWGTNLRFSDDFGKSWTNPPEAPIRFPAETGTSLKNIWQITVGASDDPDTLYCGVEPAALFTSRDGGATWTLNGGLFDHPHRSRWLPSNGGLALHTIVLDPRDRQRMYVAISTGGVYRTCDGGQTWTAQNHGVRVTFAPNKYPDFGQCVHKIAMHPARPERLFLQNHWGIYRSDDGAENWTDIANGVPSDFGFALIVHPANPDWVYMVPVESDEFRCACDGRLRVYRTRNAGASWEALSRGLPQKSAYETVLRDGMTTDSRDPTGIYFGTRSGQLFMSRDGGKSWQRIVEGFPSILCVRTAQIGDGSRQGAGRPAPGVADSVRSRSGQAQKTRAPKGKKGGRP